MASRGLLTMDPDIQPQSPCGLFQNAQEIANLGPASLKVDPLAKVMTPIEARIAADEGRIVMFSDIDCQSQIEQIATVVYEIERKAWIWHKNVRTIGCFFASPRSAIPSPSLASPIKLLAFRVASAADIKTGMW